MVLLQIDSSIFYGLMKRHHCQAFILKITDRKGNIFSNPNVIAQIFVSHFQDILSPTFDRIGTNEQTPSLKLVLIPSV